MTESICCVLLFRFSKRESSSLLERKTGSRFSQTIPSRPSPVLTGWRRKKLSIAAGLVPLWVGIDFGASTKGGPPAEKKRRKSNFPPPVERKKGPPGAATLSIAPPTHKRR